MINLTIKFCFIYCCLLSCHDPQNHKNYSFQENIRDSAVYNLKDSLDSSKGKFSLTENSGLKILSISKLPDSTSSGISDFKSSVFESWNLSEQNILLLIKNSHAISGTEWDMNYEVLPYCYTGKFLINDIKSQYRINAGGFTVLGFADTIFFLGASFKERKYFLSLPD